MEIFVDFPSLARKSASRLSCPLEVGLCSWWSLVNGSFTQLISHEMSLEAVLSVLFLHETGDGAIETCKIY